MTSPRLLEDYFAATGLAGKLPGAALVGRNFRMHINSALIVFSPFRDPDVLRKTAIFYNDKHAHSTVQCLGWIDGELLATQLPAATPEFFTNMIGSRALGFFVTTEDGSSPDNRVISNRGSRPILDYEFDRIKPCARRARGLHSRLRTWAPACRFRRNKPLDRARRHRARVGTLVTGSDPARSVVDPHGKVHGIEGLYVSDGSVLPRTSRVNPALTIYAWGLRLGEELVGMS